MGTFDSDTRTVKAQLARLLHHYDEVRPTIRVIEYEDGSFSLSMVPPPTEEEREQIVKHLQDHGYDVNDDQIPLEVVGRTD